MLNADQDRGHDSLMDKVYRNQRHLYDFTRKYYLFGRDSLIGTLDLKPGERVLEIGCGTARNLIAMARRYPEARFYGLDASAEMLKTAGLAVARAGLGDRIHLVHGLAESVSAALFGEATPFDRAIFSYSLSMIPDWEQALSAAKATLSAAGRIHVVDFGDFDGLPGPLARLLRRWLALFHVEPRVRMLKTLESDGTKTHPNSNNLRILPGRYAFVWSGTAYGSP
ncbi:MAG TPA: methyltransferase domain-containing protein [Rhizomicrobium sp.]|jgi:S-adenosylmethionine-diacylgycerolhomoserine-N-methlytransferase